LLISSAYSVIGFNFRLVFCFLKYQKLFVTLFSISKIKHKQEKNSEKLVLSQGEKLKKSINNFDKRKATNKPLY
jgi:hypothetical protein